MLVPETNSNDMVHLFHDVRVPKDYTQSVCDENASTAKEKFPNINCCICRCAQDAASEADLLQEAGIARVYSR